MGGSMMAVECPFCHWNSLMLKVEKGEGPVFGGQMYCKRCFATGPWVSSTGDDGETALEEVIADALSAWNNRKPWAGIMKKEGYLCVLEPNRVRHYEDGELVHDESFQEGE